MSHKKSLEVKIKQLEKKVEQLGKKIESEKNKRRQLSKELRGIKKRLKELVKSRDNWKEKLKDKQLHIKHLKAKVSRRDKAKGHQYSIWLVLLSILLRIKGNCSYVGIIKILELINGFFQLGLQRIPCANTVQNWVSKMGLFFMEDLENELFGQQVSLIIDESIRLGQEKLLLILCVPFEKQAQGGLGFEDVRVIYMKGATSWTGVKISEVLTKLKKEYGFEIKNILSDEDSKLRNASQLSTYPHLPDISHAIATCLRRVFDKTIDYKWFKKTIASYQSRGVNQSLSYLCPPKQRTKARFMNISKVVVWAEKLLDRFNLLNEKEKNFFIDLTQQEAFTKDLKACLDVAQQVALPFKLEGLSVKTLKKAKQLIESQQQQSTGYMEAFLTQISSYLVQYETFIKLHPKSTIHISSEVIESMFGKYKSKANNYALTGLTTLNLELPIYGKSKETIMELLTEALEGISSSDLIQWKKEKSSDNQLVKRAKFFNY